MTAEELNRVINTLIAIKDEDEFYINAYAEELIKAYAKVCVIEELESFAYLVQGADEDVMSEYIQDRIKELKQE